MTRKTINEIANSGNTFWPDFLPALYASGTTVEAIEGIMVSLAMVGKLGPVVRTDMGGRSIKPAAQALAEFEAVAKAFDVRRVFVKREGDSDREREEPREEYVYVGKAGACKLVFGEGGLSAVVSTSIAEFTQAVQDWHSANSTQEEEVGSVFYLVAGQGGLKFERLGRGGEPLERGNYAPDVLAAFDRLCDELVCAKPRGRLAIFEGPPGSGKSFCIRGLVDRCSKDSTMVIVPPGLIPTIVGPDGAVALLRFRAQNTGRPMVLILEDADEVLAPRENGNLSAISGVLNIGDGIVGSTLDIRIVATTNAKETQLDPAVKRPGRLNVFAHVGKLSPEQCSEIYTRLTGRVSEFSKSLVLAEIYQRAYDEGWTGLKETATRAIGFSRD